MTRREGLKEALLRHAIEAGGIKLHRLVTAHASEPRNAGREVEELVMELVREEKLVEFRFRLPPEFQLVSIIFPAGTVHDQKLQNNEMTERARLRPANFNDLSSSEQWDIDKALGILDWDGSR